jgi:hypothetical protein
MVENTLLVLKSSRHEDAEQRLRDLVWAAMRINRWIDGTLILDPRLEVRRRNVDMVRKFFRALDGYADWSEITQGWNEIRCAHFRCRGLLRACP